MVARTMTDQLAYRPAEAAEALRVSLPTIYRMIATGKLKSVKVGQCRLVSAKSLRAMIEKGIS